ncbi:CIC11C00000000236 [Sungouiella intermedia]|uniref:CIC11C00000000236 n=1 Tax=Sungouiella intermedia TaxID=45354 RepID=A0A1L0DIM3_9ASCO|nr:CIC11C00000000236 [[Candida] intermedia]
MIPTSFDVKLLLASVLLRRASFGLTNQVLTLFLESAGISKLRIGIFMTLTLIGDTFISYFLTWFSDNIGRRTVMVIGCLLMGASGIVFSMFLNFWVLLAAAILGVISTSGDETGPFKTVEEASLSHLTPPKNRAPTFAIYGFLGTLGSALGASTCGFLVDYWNLSRGWTLHDCYRGIFIGYSILAGLKLAIALLLSKNCELLELIKHDEPTEILAPEIADRVTKTLSQTPTIDEETNLLGGEVLQDVEAADAPVAVKSSVFDAQTKLYLPRLLVVFMLDSFGYGFMPPAWIVYYFKTVFGVTASALGTLFFFTNLIDSGSSLASAILYYKLGPVRAILAAQLPSAIFFLSIAFCPSYFSAAILYFLFCATGSMDVVPRQVLLTSIIPKQDLIRVMGTVNIAKTFARCIGPVFTGKLAEHGYLYVGYLVNGACLILADSILGFSFLHLDSHVLALHSGN